MVQRASATAAVSRKLCLGWPGGHSLPPSGPRLLRTFRALSGRLKSTVRRHNFNKDNLFFARPTVGAYEPTGQTWDRGEASVPENRSKEWNDE